MLMWCYIMAFCKKCFRHFAIRRKRTLSAAVGQRGERLAARFLENAGYDILARNYAAPHGAGEIDIVARSRSGRLCFVEVKTRRVHPGRTWSLRPASAVDEAKRRRLRRSAYCWRRSVGTRKEAPCRFDIVEVWADGLRPRWLKHWAEAFPVSPEKPSSRN